MTRLDLGDELMLQIKILGGDISEEEALKVKRKITLINARIDKRVNAIYKNKGDKKALVLVNSEALKDIYNNRLAIRNYKRQHGSKEKVNIGIRLEHASRLVEDSKLRFEDRFTENAYKQAFEINSEANEIAVNIVKKAMSIALSEVDEKIDLKFNNKYESELIISYLTDEVNKIKDKSLRKKILFSIITLEL